MQTHDVRTVRRESTREGNTEFFSRRQNLQGTNRSGEGGKGPAIYVTLDLSDDDYSIIFHRTEREKKGETTKWCAGKKRRKKEWVRVGYRYSESQPDHPILQPCVSIDIGIAKKKRKKKRRFSRYVN